MPTHGGFDSKAGEQPAFGWSERRPSKPWRRLEPTSFRIDRRLLITINDDGRPA
jgi:hypothetical protein